MSEHPFYENQEGIFRDLAEREHFLDIKSPSTLDETKATKTGTSTIEIEEITPLKRKQEQTIPAPTNRVSSLSASPIIVSDSSPIAPGVILNTPLLNNCYAPKKRKVEQKKKSKGKESWFKNFRYLYFFRFVYICACNLTDVQLHLIAL